VIYDQISYTIDYNELVCYFNQLSPGRRKIIAPIFLKNILNVYNGVENPTLTPLLESIQYLDIPPVTHCGMQKILNEYAKRRWGKILLCVRLRQQQKALTLSDQFFPLHKLPCDMMMVILGFLCYTVIKK
jgi:hypothetical protein